MSAPRCLIVGAGISGLVAARQLDAGGLPVRVLEKSRGVGGRMATRRIQRAAFDHGAQFFTARSDWFKGQVRSWIEAGAVTRWSRGFPSESGGAAGDGHPRYRGTPGMTAVARHLALDRDVRLEIRVEAVEVAADVWQVHTAGGETFTGDVLVLTSPVPQSLALLAAGGTELSPATASELGATAYDPCLAALVLLEEPARFPEPGAVQFAGGPLRWAADNQQKGVSPDAPALTLHADAGYSRENWDAPDEQIVAELMAAIQPWVVGEMAGFQVQRWRYSQPIEVLGQRSLVVPGPPRLVFAGDAFGGPKVEGAALSGRDAAQEIIRKIGAGPRSS